MSHLFLLLLACTDPKGPGADGGAADGGAADGGAPDGGAADGGTGDGGAGDGGAGDGGADGGGADGGSGDGGAALGEGPRCALPASPPAPADAEITLTRVFSPLSFSLPIHLEQDQAGRWWVVEQQVGVRSFVEGDSSAPLALDLRGQVVTGYEAGVIGFALHPDFPSDARAWVVTTVEPRSADQALLWRLSRYESPDGQTLDPDSEVVVLEVDQPYTNHNGGGLRFGPDGMLYVSLGDGGDGGDPLGNGQDPYDLLGSLLRIDVDVPGPGYEVPIDNPFADGVLGAPEVYAWGLRNVWSFSFDRGTGELWAGDVGQGSWEEVDRIEAGGNYGWNLMEGAHCYIASCDRSGLVLPLAEYDHSLGRSITGGVVYRGSNLALFGSYLYADFLSGRLWALALDAGSGDYVSEELLATDDNWSAFAQTAEGEVLLVSMYEGAVFRIDPLEEGEPDPFPRSLSETGCVDPEDPGRVADGLLPYEIVHPFWSDGADKSRWLSLPEGSAATVEPDGDLSLPAGAVAVKEFRLDGRRFETRLLAHHEDGTWAGYSYRWAEDGSDALLLEGSLREQVEGQTWHYPSGAECRACHTDVAGLSLGLELAQLGELADTWRAKGFLSGAAEVPALLPLDDADLEGAARSWLHANCSFCHRPEGPGGGRLDLRFSTALGETGLCAPPEQGELGIDGALILAPGAPERSVLLARIRDLGAYRMPPLGSLVVDEAGAARIEAWIAAMGECG